MNKITPLFLRLLGLLAVVVFSAGADAQPRLKSAPAKEASSDGILFHNGDSLAGELLSIDVPDAVRWKHPDVTEPVDFKLDSISQIDFPESKTSAKPSSATCRLLLTDGDSFAGDFISCDRDAVTLQTWFGGRLRILRSALQSLVFLPRSPAIFDGITGLDGWTKGGTIAAFAGESGEWVYRNGAFYASKASSIARNLHLPDVAEVQFDLAWKGGLNLAIALYTDSLQPILLTGKDQGPDFGGFYSFRFQNTVILDMSRIKKMEPIRSLGQLIVPALNLADRLHVDLRISKPQHKIALFFDDSLVKEWDDPAGFVGEGTGMRFVQNPGGVVKLSNLLITHWNGLFEETPDPADLGHDFFFLENTNLSGSLESITNGTMVARAGGQPLLTPVSQIKAINFAHLLTGTISSPLEPGTVRATFAQGGEITFILESWRPGEMIVRSPSFGKATLNPAAFTRLEFLFPKKSGEEPKS